MEYGIGYEGYPDYILALADVIFEGAGYLPTQDEILDYDPVYVRDFFKRRRLKRVMQKENKREMERDFDNERQGD